jgi:protein-disulfide isomerase
MIAAIIIGILLVVSLYFNFARPPVSGPSSLDSVSKKTLETVNTKLLQPGMTATLANSSVESGMYKMTFTINGNAVESYVSTDGRYLFAASTAIDLNSIPAREAPVPEVPVKADKPVVELFVMSYCPFGTQAEKGIIPAIEALGDKVDFQLRFVYYSMHGEKEMTENTLQYCIQKEQKAKLLPYLKCFLDQGDSASCLTSTGVDEAKLKTCTDAADSQFNITASFNDKASWLSGQYPLYNVDSALNEKYSVGGSPTLVLNGKESSAGRAPKSYFDSICASFNTAPDSCKTANLSSTTYGSGFGYTQTASDASASAQCG